MACSRSAREARPDSASTPTDWGCGSSTDEAALVASCGQVGGAAVPACASHVERQCKRACAVMPVRVDMWAWALRMHARTDAFIHIRMHAIFLYSYIHIRLCAYTSAHARLWMLYMCARQQSDAGTRTHPRDYAFAIACAYRARTHGRTPTGMHACMHACLHI